MDLSKLKVFVDVHNVGVKSNEVDKSEGVTFCCKWMVISCDLMMSNLLLFICYIMFCVCESL